MSLIDLPSLREKLVSAPADSALAGLWRRTVRQVTADARAHAWLTPLVAAVTKDRALAGEAAGIIRAYLDTAEIGPLGAGVQFHFWCYAFPHARWAAWFDLLAGVHPGPPGPSSTPRPRSRP
ncbi:MAG: hypothetical protein ACOCZE_07255, partial [Planctomycetota bacterium]